MEALAYSTENLGERFMASAFNAEEFMTLLGEELSRERRLQGYVLEEMADKLGVSVRTLQYVEKGSNPMMMHYIKYASLLGLNYPVVVARTWAVLQARQAGLV